MKRINIDMFRRGQIAAGALLSIFLFYYINVTAFLHYHVVDGVTIVHSHIFTDGHTDNTEVPAHTERELTLISALSNYFVEEQSTLHINNSVEVKDLAPYLVSNNQQQIITKSQTLALLRAPPVA